jgi:hypothetical protein
LIFSHPFLLLSLVPAALRRARQSQVRRSEAKAAEPPGNGIQLKSVVISMTGAFSIQLATLLLFFYATVRYLLEIVPFAMLLAAVGFWQACRDLARQPRARTLFVVLAVALATLSILASVLLAFSSDGEWIRQHNPAFVTQLIRLFRALDRQF